MLATETELAGLCPTVSEIPKSRFLGTMLKCTCMLVNDPKRSLITNYQRNVFDALAVTHNYEFLFAAALQ